MRYGTWFWISFDAGRRRPRSASGDSFNSSRSIYFTADYFGLPDNAPGCGLGSLTVNLLGLHEGLVLESAVQRTFRVRSLGLVCIRNLRSDGPGGVWAPRPLRERCFACESRNSYSSGMVAEMLRFWVAECFQRYDKSRKS